MNKVSANFEPEIELQTASTLNIPIEANKSPDQDAVKSATLGASNDLNNFTVEGLIEDVKARDKAINICGQDIRALRQERNDLLGKLREAAEKEEQANKMLESALNLSSTQLKNLTNETMVQIIIKLTDKVANMNFENQALIDAMQEAKQSIKSLVDLKAKYKDLENAHMVQSKQTQKLQNQMKKVDTYKRTIETQEKVITKMQRVIESSVRGGWDSSSPSPTTHLHEESPVVGEVGPHTVASDIHAERHDELENQIVEYKERIADLETQVSELKSSNSEEVTKENNTESSLAEATRKIDILEAELISKGYRIEALQEQLESSAKEYSDEIAKLRTKVFELEMNSTAFDGSDGTNDLSAIDFPEIRSLEEMIALSRQSSSAEAAAVPVGSAVSAANALRNSQSANVIGVTATAAAGPPVAEGSSDSSVGQQQEKLELKASAKEGELGLQKDSVPPGEERKGNDVLQPQKSEGVLPQPPSTAVAQASNKEEQPKQSSKKVEEKPKAKSPTKNDSGAQKLSMDIKRVNGNVEVVSCHLNIYLNLQHQRESSPYEYSIYKIEVSDFLEEDMKGIFQPFVDITVGDDETWSSSTAPMYDAGSEVQWLYPDKKQAFMITAGQKKEGCSLHCIVKKLADETSGSIGGGAAVLLGKGRVRL